MFADLLIDILASISQCLWTLMQTISTGVNLVMQAVQAAQELRFGTLWAADNLHQFIGDFFIHCLQPFQVNLTQWSARAMTPVLPQGRLCVSQWCCTARGPNNLCVWLILLRQHNEGRLLLIQDVRTYARSLGHHLSCSTADTEQHVNLFMLPGRGDLAGDA